VKLLKNIGPAIIVASVVLGPGSIVASSRVGTQYGYDMIWVLASAAVLLVGMTAMSARLGVQLDGTLCDELRSRVGRPVAALVGLTLFLVAACFQFGNNLGVLFALEPFFGTPQEWPQKAWPVTVLLLLNVAIVIALFGLRNLYRPVERLMKFLVGVMLVGFAANLVFAKPAVLSVLAGFLPTLPEDTSARFLPYVATVPPGGTPKIVDGLLSLQALVATTFSVGGAYYHAYLVRQRGWTVAQLRQGLIDSVVGISVLGCMTLMILVTAAAVLHGRPEASQFRTAADIALQLRPLFGPWATGLFCMGILAGALSSFLVNAMIGGTVLSDGLGKGGSMDQRWPKMLTVLVLVMGMVIAIGVKAAGWNIAQLIIFAQALTILGNPLLAGALLWLATRKDVNRSHPIPLWMKIVSGIGFVVVLLVSFRTAVRLYLQVTVL
jgi:manganese transport protein